MDTRSCGTQTAHQSATAYLVDSNDDDRSVRRLGCGHSVCKQRQAHHRHQLLEMATLWKDSHQHFTCKASRAAARNVTALLVIHRCVLCQAIQGGDEERGIAEVVPLHRPRHICCQEAQHRSTRSLTTEMGGGGTPAKHTERGAHMGGERRSKAGHMCLGRKTRSLQGSGLVEGSNKTDARGR